MKKENLYKKLILPGCLVLIGGLSSCDDFLTLYPSNQITDEQFWEDKKDLESVLGAAYRNMASNIVKPTIAWGECRSDNFVQKRENNNSMRDLMNANLLPTDELFDWSSFYTTINYANKVLEHGDVVMARDPSFTQGDWNAVKAEAMAIRALNYFYLVRAFRDVPYVDKSIDTDEQALSSKPARTASQVILTNIIADLESVQNLGMVNYGNVAFNKGRFTRNAIRSLLADVYLWRASKNSSPDSVAKYPNMAVQDYEKSAEYATMVIADMKATYDKNYGNNNMGGSSSTENKYPLITMDRYQSTTMVLGEAKYMIFDQGNSIESIFEIQYGSGSGIYNAALNDYFYRLSQTGACQVSASTLFQGVSEKVDNEDRLYSETDFRMWENIFYEKAGQTIYEVGKYGFSETTIANAEKVSQGAAYLFSLSGDVQNNWVVYRLTEVMLIRAEALVQLGGEENMAEAFELVNAVFKRSNPKVKAENGLQYTAYSTPKAMEGLVMRERQRELFAEGKRWFDLVRYAERNASTKPMLDLLLKKYSSNANAIKSKLGTLNSLYNPIVKSELKINPNLVQNPVWTTDESISKN